MGFPSEPAAHLLGANGPVHAVAYSASPGTYILTGSADRSIRLYNPFPSTSVPGETNINKNNKKQPPIPQGRLIQTYAAHGYEVLGLAVAADNRRFVSCGGDRAVLLWDVSTAQTVRRFGANPPHGHVARVNSVAYAGESDSLVASAGFDTTVRLWDVRASGPRPVQVLDDARDAVTSVVVRGAEVVAGSVDGRVRNYDVRMGTRTTDVLGASVTSLALTRDGRAALVATLDSKLRLMDRDSGACLRAYADTGRRNEDLRVQAVLGGGEKYVVAGDEMARDDDAAAAAAAAAAADGKGRIWAWDLLTGRLVAKVAVPWGPEGYEGRRRAVGRDGKEKTRSNVVSCIAWREKGWGDQFCVGGTSGVVTVFGELS